jgi:hypothetical protein
MSRKVVVMLAFTAGALAGTASAQSLDGNVQVHGFGSWAFGDTSANRYLAGEPAREYRHTTLGMSVDASPTDRLRVVGQAVWTESDEGTRAVFDYAFAEWKISDSFRLRAGQVKLPFGALSEVARIGTLRPFLDLPQAVYGPIGLTGEHYRGLGVTGRHSLGGKWELEYDVYGGGMVLQEFLPPEAYLLGEPIDPENTTEFEETGDLIGGRAVFDTPVDGLRLGLSGYSGRETGSNRRSVFGAHVEYVAGPWSLRSEYAHELVVDDLKVDGFYAEAAYRFGSHWQVAGQYGHLTTAVHEAPDPSVPSLLDHEEVVGGLNYWFSPSFVLKLDYHRVNGNRFAAPDGEDFVSVVESGNLKAKTNLVQFGAQFSF